MARIEIEEADLLANQGVVNTVKAMLGNPEARKLVLKAQKIVKPDAVIPEIDAAVPFQTELEKMREESRALTKRLDDEKAEREARGKIDEFTTAWENQKSGLRREGYLTETIDEIEKLAKERGIPDLEAAAALHTKLHPPAEPASPSGFGSFNFFEPSEKEGEDMKKLLETRGESEGVLNTMIQKGLADVRGTRRTA